MYRKVYFGIILICICLQSCCGPFITTGIIAAGTVAAISTGIHWGRCYIQECCTERWTKPNITETKEALTNIFKNELFGQHLVAKVVPKVIYNHISDDNPKKALAMSFHGWTGCGKSFVSKLIAKFIYREGMLSKYVHLVVATQKFPDPNKLDIYKQQLQKFIVDKTTDCGRSLFIFDEMDKMPAGLTDVLKHFLEYHERLDGVDFRKNIFIFLNNVGGNEISKVTHLNFKSGAPREDIQLKKMEEILSKGSLKLVGGFQDSDLIVSGLIDFFLPFLPLERKHVKQCVLAEISRRTNKSSHEQDHREIVDTVADELQYDPHDEKIFSRTGCKQVAKKVDSIL